MELTDIRFAEYLTTSLNDEINRITEVIIDSEVKDLTELYHLKGKIEGLRIALREVTEKNSQVIEED
tara:strand:+ start:653 stop:853 length:201 start_codon:yes stop_codon:yes gene_type:complete